MLISQESVKRCIQRASMYPKRLPRFGLVKICDLVTLFKSAEKEDYKNVISCAEVLFLHQLLGSG